MIRPIAARVTHPSAFPPSFPTRCREALAVNVEGRKVTAPDDGFGKLWRKRYWIRLAGSSVTPAELVAI